MSCIGENLLDEPLPLFCLATSLAACVFYTMKVWWPEAEVRESANYLHQNTIIELGCQTVLLHCCYQSLQIRKRHYVETST